MAKPPVASGSNGSKNKLTPLEARINKAGLAAPNAVSFSSIHSSSCYRLRDCISK